MQRKRLPTTRGRQCVLTDEERHSSEKGLQKLLGAHSLASERTNQVHEGSAYSKVLNACDHIQAQMNPTR